MTEQRRVRHRRERYVGHRERSACKCRGRSPAAFAGRDRAFDLAADATEQAFTMSSQDAPLLSAAASSWPDPDAEHAEMRRRGNLLGSAAAAFLIWLAAAALAVVVSDAGLSAAALPAALALTAALIGRRRPLVRRLGEALAVAAAAVEPSIVLPWTVAAVCLSYAVEQRAAAIAIPDLGELERCLERCRRRGDPATVLVLEVPSDAVAVRNLFRTVRVTDSFVIRRFRRRFEVCGLLEECDVARATIEARLASSLHGVRPRLGWASYPVDGLTLDALLEHARTSLVAEPDRGARLHGELTDTGSQSDPVIAVTFDPASEAGQS
jgi:hypothetical protein